MVSIVCRTSGAGCTYGFKCFGDYDGVELLRVREEAMPYRRALQYHAATAVAFQKARGMLRDNFAIMPEDFAVASDSENKPETNVSDI